MIYIILNLKKWGTNMLDIKEIKLILNECIKTGGDYAELFFEDTISNNIEHSKGFISNIISSNIYGVGIRILKNHKEVYGYTNKIDKDSILKIVYNLRDFFENPTPFDYDLKEIKINKINPIKKPLNKVKIKTKVELLNNVYKHAKEYSNLIEQVIINLSDRTQNVYIYNTLGKIVKDTRSNVRLTLSCIAKKDNNLQRGSNSLGGNIGFELFDDFDPKSFAYEASKTAVLMLDAKDIVSGEMPVVINNGFGGVILHEAVGHSLEATSVAVNLSVLSNLRGKQIASKLVTAIDDGTLTNQWGSLNVDDEGENTTRNVLIKDGILMNYIVDMKNDRIMKHGVTGSSRRESYKYSPTSRMTNTFIENGESTFDEIISNTKYGLFAKKLGGGSVNTTTGEYNFSVTEAYMIEDGKITYPVKNATLVGQGKKTLLDIDMVGNNLKLDNGVCGASSGNIAANVGQPTIRVSKMTVGGKGGII